MEESDRENILLNLKGLSAATVWNAALEEKLLDHKVFSKAMVEDIKNDRDVLRRLYEKVCKRGPKAFNKLIHCLVESGNQDAAKILDPNIRPVAQPPPQRPSSLDLASTSSDAAVVVPAAVGLRSPIQGVPNDLTVPLMVSVKKAVRFLGPPQLKSCYPMTCGPRGFCLIINNEEFDFDETLKRQGSTVDAKNLESLFQQLHFETEVRQNLALADIMREVVLFAQKAEHGKADMAVVVVLSHGGNGQIFASDGRKVDNEWILKQFNGENCPRLVGKPKLFIFQACRGDEEDHGVVTSVDVEEMEALTEVDAVGFCPLAPRKESVWKDMLIAYATVPGQVANRNRRRGTWFIESICKVFMNHAADMDLKDMMDEVSQEMQTYQSENGTMQSCSYEVRTFNRKLFFNPGFVGGLKID